MLLSQLQHAQLTDGTQEKSFQNTWGSSKARKDGEIQESRAWCTVPYGAEAVETEDESQALS